MNGWEIIKDATFKLTGDYRVVDEKGNTVMADTAYYPQAPEYDEALRIVNAINELEAKDELIAELVEAFQNLGFNLMSEAAVSSRSGQMDRLEALADCAFLHARSKAKLNTPNDTGV